MRTLRDASLWVGLLGSFNLSAANLPDLGSFMPAAPISLGVDWNLINRLPVSDVSAPVNCKGAT